MRRRAVIVPIVLSAALLAWRRRRARARRAALEAAAAARPVAAPPVPPARLPAGPPAEPRFVSVPWTLVAAPEDRAELTVRYAADRSMDLDRVDAQETPTQVFVTVLVHGRRPATGAAPAGEEREATVALSAPLGGRELVHAATDLPATAGGEPDDPPLYP